MLKIFESRNKNITNLVKLGDYLGYSLRENLQLFSIEDTEKRVTYITESDKVISGNYSVKDNNYVLENINIEDSSIFTDTERFDSKVKDQISLFLEGLYQDEYTSAEDKFTDVIDIIVSRSSYDNTASKLKKKTQIFNESHNILEAEEFSRFVEIIPELVTFLAENQDSIKSQVPEITNSLKLSEAVSQAFSVPKTTTDELEKLGRFEFKDNFKKSIYEMICQQELIKKELLEAKNSFDLVWAHEPVIDSLANKVYAPQEEVGVALTEALKELPYIALLSKKKLFETLSRNLGHSTEHISEKELKAHCSLLFEMKKPAKEQLTTLLGEKYGVNLQYLKESYSFKSLINTQRVLFEAISRITPKNSVLKQVLSELSTHMKDKTGVQSLDVNNVIQQIFQHAEYSQENLPLMELFSFDEVKAAFEKSKVLVENIIKEDDEGDEEAPVPQEGEDSPTDDEREEKEEKEKEEKDSEADEGESGEVQEEEVDPPEQMSDAEVMKAVKSISDIVNGTEIENDEEEY
jgi:hypothetical protein